MSSFSTGGGGEGGARSFARGKRRIALPRPGGTVGIRPGAGVPFGSASVAAGAGRDAAIANQIIQKAGNTAVAGGFLEQQKQIELREDLNEALRDAAPIVAARLEQGLKIDPMGSEKIADMAERGSGLIAARDDMREWDRRINLPKDHEEAINIEQRFREDGSQETRAEAVMREQSRFASDRVPEEWTEKTKSTYISKFMDGAGTITTKHLKEQDQVVMQDAITKLQANIAPDEIAATSESLLGENWELAKPLYKALGFSEAAGKRAFFKDAAVAAALSETKNLDNLNQYLPFLSDDPDFVEALKIRAGTAIKQFEAAQTTQAKDDFALVVREGTPTEAAALSKQQFDDKKINNTQHNANLSMISSHVAKRKRDANAQFFDAVQNDWQRHGGPETEAEMEKQVRTMQDQGIIDHSQGNTMRKLWGETRKQGRDVDTIRKGLSSVDGSRSAITSDQNNAYGQVLVDDGIFEGDAGTGKPTNLVEGQEGNLAEYAKRLGALHPSHKSLMVDGLSNRLSARGSRDAGRAYAIMTQKNSLLANHAVKDMTMKGKIRAMMIRDGISKIHGIPMEIPGEKGQAVVNPDWTREIDRLTQQASDAQLPDGKTITEMNNQSTKTIWGDTTIEQSRADVIDAVDQHMAEGMENNTDWGRGRSPAIVSTAVLNDYRTFTSQQHTIAQVMGLNDEAAKEFAMREGMNMLMSKYHATRWNNQTTMTTPQPEFFSPLHADTMKIDLSAARRKGMLVRSPIQIEAEYTPVYDPQATGQRINEDGEKETITGGWILIDASGSPLMLNIQDESVPGAKDGAEQPFVFRPDRTLLPKDTQEFVPIDPRNAEQARQAERQKLDSKIEDIFDFVLGAPPITRKKDVKRKAPPLPKDFGPTDLSKFPGPRPKRLPRTPAIDRLERK